MCFVIILHFTFYNANEEFYKAENHESKVKSNDERQSQSSQIGALVVNGKRFTIQFHFERNQKRTFKVFFSFLNKIRFFFYYSENYNKIFKGKLFEKGIISLKF